MLWIWSMLNVLTVTHMKKYVSINQRNKTKKELPQLFLHIPDTYFLQWSNIAFKWKQFFL